MITAVAIFIGLVLVLLALDLLVINRKDHEPTMKEALGWSAFWISLALAFAIPLEMAYANNWFELGGGRIDPVDGSALTGGLAVGKYLAAYVMEKALSVDNLFVIATVFAMFKVPKELGLRHALDRPEQSPSYLFTFDDFHWLFSPVSGR